MKSEDDPDEARSSARQKGPLSCLQIQSRKVFLQCPFRCKKPKKRFVPSYPALPYTLGHGGHYRSSSVFLSSLDMALANGFLLLPINAHDGVHILGQCVYPLQLLAAFGEG